MLTNFKRNCKLITVDLSKQNTIDADLKAFQQTLFQGVSEKNKGWFLKNQKKQCLNLMK